ncbi:non-ribosomal peptide synthetase [Wenjunlia tyrosinilytica]|uniref:Carrier domain-containing protein n=1 Tax=Wenjunlia tyrosinilytica TaxID=1544741 RepID=A0A917ZW18_9ACTN|nr:non-ribosomal peptide synthetase [Wenjunlia tyrosinilytica]GGO96054.1 hypothetical protein GCM10012280_54700 [Wenjunlia tyrosinilytica]
MNEKTDIEAIYPLSQLQHAMLLKSQLAPNSGVYIVQLSFDICGPLDLKAFRAAWNELTARHAVHRTLFARLDQSQPLQVVRRSVELPWTEEDWSALSAPEQDARFDAWFADDRTRDFDPAQAPLMRCFLARLADHRHRFCWTRHHAISDGWSMANVAAEVLQDYRDRTVGTPFTFGPVPQYREYIAWSRAQNVDRAEEFWRRSLAGVQGPTLLGVDRSPQTGYLAPGRIDRRRVLLSPESTRAVSAAARRERLTPGTFVQGAWAILLRRYGDERDVMLGVAASGRPPVIGGVEKMIGCFVNTLPVRIEVDDDAMAIDWLRQLQAAQVEREEYGYVSLAQIRRWTGVRGDVPLFESLLAFENFPIGEVLEAVGGPIRVEAIRMSEQTSFPLTLTVAPGDQLSIQLAFDESRFDEAAIEGMLDHYAVILQALTGAPGRIRDLPIAGPEELGRLLGDFNAARVEIPDLPAHRLFEAQAASTPGSVALVAGRTELTYAELNARADRLARRLRGAGVTPGALVGVCLERDAELPVALLAAWKAGAAYLPLDPAYPPSRLDQILGDAAPAAVLAQQSTHGALAGSSSNTLLIDRSDSEADDAEDAGPASAEVHEESVAIVIYTSGSTGRPKGVRFTHRNVTGFLTWSREFFSREDLGGTLASTSICFDPSVCEIFLPLTVGGTVILADNVLDLPTLPARDRVTLVSTVPSAVDTLLGLGDLPASVRVVNLAGEPLPRDLVDQLYAQPGVRDVYNLYGSTEHTVYSTVSLVPRDGAKPLIGRPTPNAQIYVLDANGVPVPCGIVGELYAGGEGVTQGYHERPSLTAERYLPDPFGGRPGARLYRTGDLARWLPDGRLEYLGRNDRQVKLRGFRIELGEVESELRKLTGIRDAVAVVREDEPGTKRLVAYVISADGHVVERADVTRALRERLPEHMVPAALVELSALPLMPNGKADLQALPAPDVVQGQRTHREPSTEVERTIAAVWAEILGIPNPGVDERFFDVGGDSMLLVRVFGRLRQRYPDRLVLTDLFKNPTISSLAESIAGTESQPAFTGVQDRLARRRAAQGGR